MRNIEISEDTLKQLRMAARPDETSELVIKRLLDQHETDGKQASTKKYRLVVRGRMHHLVPVKVNFQTN